MAMGPVQMLVLGFAEPNFTGKIAAELDRLRQSEFVKIVDALVVNKDDEGNITALQVSDLTQDESIEMGAIAGALIGFGYGGDDDDEPEPPDEEDSTGVWIGTYGGTPNRMTVIAAPDGSFAGLIAPTTPPRTTAPGIF